VRRKSLLRTDRPGIAVYGRASNTKVERCLGNASEAREASGPDNVADAGLARLRAERQPHLLSNEPRASAMRQNAKPTCSGRPQIRRG
jgi:hypothetical protein